MCSRYFKHKTALVGGHENKAVYLASDVDTGTEKFKSVSQPHYCGSINKEWVESTDVTRTMPVTE